MNPRPSHSIALAVGAAVVLLGGCTALPALQVLSLASTATALSLRYADTSSSSDTVHSGAAAPKEVCIEFNPTIAAADLVPALQNELQRNGVKSRVFAKDAVDLRCQAWLRYAGEVRWDVPPIGNEFRPYLVNLSLAMYSAEGRLLSSSRYRMGSDLALVKWAPTQSKVSPVVHSLITGFDS